MSGILVTWLVSGLSVLIMATLVPGIHVNGLVGALIAAPVIGLVNALVRPLLQLITLPISIVTLGLFLLVINGFCLVIADRLAGSAFDIDNFGWAVVGAIVLSIVSALMHRILFSDQG